MIEQFWDGSPGSGGTGESGGFYFTGVDHDPLITRTKSAHDHSIPSGNAVAALDLFRLHYHTGHADYMDRAEQVLKLFLQTMKENPFGHASLSAALDFYLDRPKEIVVVGEKASPQTRKILKQIHSLYLPNKTLVITDPHQPGPGKLPSQVAEKIAAEKTQKTDAPTVYVCHDFTCSMPVTEWESLEKLLMRSY